MTDIASIAADLAAEQQSLDDVVAGLTPEQWATPTPSPGWTVRDQIGHLTYFDGTATLAATDPDAFQAALEELMGSGDGMEKLTLLRDLGPEELLARWRQNRATPRAAGAEFEDGQRLPCDGPSVGAKPFLTARLRECWAHGTDVVDAVDGYRPPADRLRHVAQIGFIIRGWTYANRGEEVPSGDVRVELTSPSGADVWTFGPDDAEATVRGPAEHFCQVVTQRRHLDDTDLVVEGEVARDWLSKAQAYAGPPMRARHRGGSTDVRRPLRDERRGLHRHPVRHRAPQRPGPPAHRRDDRRLRGGRGRRRRARHRSHERGLGVLRGRQPVGALLVSPRRRAGRGQQPEDRK